MGSMHRRLVRKGKPLRSDLVRKDRQAKITTFISFPMFKMVPLADAYNYKGPIGTMWVDVSKGDDEEPNCRSRLVAKDYRRKGDDSIYAPTPPLEAIRTLLMMAATPKR